MEKQQIIDAIRHRNQTAEQEFLAAFDQDSLTAYLTRLTEVHGQRGRSSVWVRRGDAPAVATRLKMAG